MYNDFALPNFCILQMAIQTRTKAIMLTKHNGHMLRHSAILIESVFLL